jgi:hypothetical protein
MMKRVGNAPPYSTTGHLKIVFDLRIPGAAKRLHRGRAVWQEFTDIEAIDEDHFVLIVDITGFLKERP